MHCLHKSHPAALGTAAAILGSLTTLVGANPVPMPEEAKHLYHQLLRRDPPAALPQKATAADVKWQPSLDFDTDGCYNTPAIGANGDINPGLDNYFTSLAGGCHDASDLDNNNVYSRQRCNNGWCVYLYDYYFEKDVSIPYFLDVGGHRNDWEHIAVFVQGDTAKLVAASQHGGYETKSADDVRWDGTHPKMVYHKDGAGTHCFRFANAADDAIENHKGVWFRGALVSYNGFPSTALRDKLFAYDFGKATIAIKDSTFQGNIDKARGNGGAPGFDSSRDDDGSPGNP